MKIWKIVRDTDWDSSADIFSDEEEARKAFAAEVEMNWDHFMGEDHEMPDDIDEAWEIITSKSSCVDTLYLSEDKLTLPPVYEAAPDLLDAIHGILALAESYLNIMPDRRGVLTARLDAARAAIAKAEGRDEAA